MSESDAAPPPDQPPRDERAPAAPPRAPDAGADPGLAAQDFEAALHEIESNLNVRRLMIVVANVLVPACTMATVNALSGSNVPEALQWLPHNVLWIVGGVLALGGVWTSAILARCHFGLVVNGTKMAKVQHGTLHAKGLNWLGVTTNFLALTALSAGAGVALCGAVLGYAWVGVAGGLGLVAGLMVMLRVQHARANALCARLDPTWQHGTVPKPLLEQHVRKSLDSTSADVAVVVTMAAALFAGTFDAASNLGSLGADAIPGLRTEDLQVAGVAGLMLFTLASLLLTSRIVVRLRIALAQHATALAKLRDEQDDPWRFSLWERTHLLYLIVALLASASALMGVWTLARAGAGGVAAGLVFAAHVAWYPIQLAAARRRAR